MGSRLIFDDKCEAPLAPEQHTWFTTRKEKTTEHVPAGPLLQEYVLKHKLSDHAKVKMAPTGYVATESFDIVQEIGGDRIVVKLGDSFPLEFVDPLHAESQVARGAARIEEDKPKPAPVPSVTRPARPERDE